MLRKFLFPLLLCAAISPAAFGTTAAVDHPGALPILLGLDKVRTELQIDSLQRAVLDSLREEYKSAARKLVDPMPVTPEQRAAAERQLVQLNEHYNKRALSVLNKTQRKRMGEIEHQMLGATELYSPSVQKKVGLTSDQKKRIESVRLKGIAYVGKINHRFEDGKIGYHDRIDLLRQRRLAQGVEILKILTPEQRQVFASLSGEKFAISQNIGS
jgi:hypothetical protein